MPIFPVNKIKEIRLTSLFYELLGAAHRISKQLLVVRSSLPKAFVCACSSKSRAEALEIYLLSQIAGLCQALISLLSHIRKPS